MSVGPYLLHNIDKGLSMVPTEAIDHIGIALTGKYLTEETDEIGSGPVEVEMQGWLRCREDRAIKKREGLTYDPEPPIFLKPPGASKGPHSSNVALTSIAHS